MNYHLFFVCSSAYLVASFILYHRYERRCIFINNYITETEDGINIEVNNANIKCLTSVDNKFNIDSDGNLLVNSITTTVPMDNQINYSEIFNLVYPVGTIYLSVSNTPPNVLFGGTWTEWGKGRTIVGIDSSQTEFNTVEKIGGAKNHILTTAQLPVHNHYGSSNYGGEHYHNTQGYGVAANAGSVHLMARHRITSDPVDGGVILPGGSHTHTINIGNTGNGEAHNNLQPYITCHMWRRIS